MNTYRKVAHMVMDELKLMSDDMNFTLDHVIYLLGIYRAMILKQRYSDARKSIPDSNYQVICLNLEKAELYEGLPCLDSDYLKSIEKIPSLMSISNTKVYQGNFFNTEISYIGKERFRYVGNNKYLRNIIYGTKSDSYLYLRSSNPQFMYIKCVKMRGIFEDPEEAAKLECEADSPCDILDKRFPLEEGLISTVIQLVVQELGNVKNIPEDNANDASDPSNNRYNTYQPNTDNNNSNNNSNNE